MLIIPIVTIIFLYKFFECEVAPWEYCFPILGSIIVIWIASLLADYGLSRDEEFHGGWVVKAVWDEKWTETYTDIKTYTDSDGKTQTRVVVKTRHHPDQYHVYDSNDYTVSINRSHYQDIVNTFNNVDETKPFRSGQSSFGDGRRFTTFWQGEAQTFIPCFTSHWYKNKIARSHSIFNFRKISKQEREQYGLFEYPRIYNDHYQDSILGWSDPEAEQILTTFNAKFGAIKQLRIFLLVFNGQPLEAGILQQSYWKNGNKNELIICVGINPSMDIQWVFPFAWDNENLIVKVKDTILEYSKFDAKKLVDDVTPIIQKDFQRKQFKDFEYIKIDPPFWVISLCFIIILIINMGIVIYIVGNKN